VSALSPQPGSERVRPHGALRIVRRRRRKGLIQREGASRVAPLVIAVAIAVATIVFAVLLEQVVLAQTAFKLADLTRRASKADRRHQELLVRWARLQSPNRIERYAHRRLGMVDPSPDRVGYLVANVPLRTGARLAAHRHTVPAAGSAAQAPIDLFGTGP
jgi:Cell division protein FtsL